MKKDETGIVFDRDLSEPETKMKKRVRKPRQDYKQELKQEIKQEPKPETANPVLQSEYNQDPFKNETVNMVNPYELRQSQFNTNRNIPDKKADIDPMEQMNKDNNLQLKKNKNKEDDMIDYEGETLNAPKKQKEKSSPVNNWEDDKYEDKEYNDYGNYNYNNDDNTNKLPQLNNNKQGKSGIYNTNDYDEDDSYMNNNNNYEENEYIKKQKNQKQTNDDYDYDQYNMQDSNAKRGKNDSGLIKYIELKCHKECNEMSKMIAELSMKKDGNMNNEYSKPIDGGSMNKDEFSIQLNTLRGEIDKKNRVVQSLTITNKRQRDALESLSKQIDEKLGKVNFNVHYLASQKGNSKDGVVNRTTGNMENRKNNSSLEQTLKLKEKELRNAIALIEILSKDNNQLKTSLDTYGEYKKKLQLLDLSKSKDTEIQGLMTEITLLKHQLDEHKQCQKCKTELEANITILKSDIKNYKKEIVELKKKTALTVCTTETGPRTVLPKIKAQSAVKVINTSSNTRNISYGNKVKNTSVTPTNNKPNSFKDKVPSLNELYIVLFTEEEKTAISKFFNDTESYEKFAKKIVILEKYKISIKGQYETYIKQLMDKISSLDEQIEYLNQKNKESESRLKIFQYQVNEYKQGKKAYQKKINQYQSNTHELEDQMKAKKKEITILSKQLDSLRAVGTGKDIIDNGDLDYGSDINQNQEDHQDGDYENEEDN